MAKLDDFDDIDALIDKAVDTFFVEAPSVEEEESFQLDPAAQGPSETPRHETPHASGPTLDEAVESLFTSAFQEPEQEPSGPPASLFKAATTIVSSGDDEIDRAIDLAVDTLFVEEPDSAPPETTQIEVESARAQQEVEVIQDVPPPPPPLPPLPKVAPGPRKQEAPVKAPSYEDVMAQEIERHMRTIYSDSGAPAPPQPPAPAAKARPPRIAPPERPPAPAPIPRPQAPPPPVPPPLRKAPVPEPPRPRPSAARPPARPAVPEPAPPPAVALRPKKKVSPLLKLQEAILTLEWEISKRSIAILTSELQKLRHNFQDDMTVDFAAVAMKLVLQYLAQRMSKAHPESIRFLLEVTDFLDRNVAEPNRDPLAMFHRILTRYDTFKSVVRKAEGLPDRKAALLNDLEIADPHAFAKMVEAQAITLIKAGRSLAKGLDRSNDPNNLIRSFRFLVNRSVNRILESTRKEKGDRSSRKQAHPDEEMLQ